MPSCKPERRIASSEVGAQFAIARFFSLVGLLWRVLESGKIAFSATIPGRYPFLSLRLFNFLRHFDCLILRGCRKVLHERAPDGRDR